jgi:general secretion pathway protein L
VLAELSAAGIHPATVVPEILLLPWQKGQLSLFIENQTGAEARCLIRFGECEGMACSLQNLQFVLQVLLNETAEAPENIVLFAHAETAAIVRQQLPPLLQSRVTLQPLLAWQTLATSNVDLNLLQGAFAPRLPWHHWWRQWRLVAMLLVGLLITDVVATTLQAAKVRQATAAIDEQIVDLFRSVQPDAAIVDPRLQLERAVTALGGRTHEGLTELLDRMAPALEASPAIQVQNLDYNSSTGELQLVIVSEGFAAAEALRAGLQSLGLEAELLGSSSEGTSSRSRLRVVI